MAMHVAVWRFDHTAPSLKELVNRANKRTGLSFQTRRVDDNWWLFRTERSRADVVGHRDEKAWTLECIGGLPPGILYHFVELSAALRDLGGKPGRRANKFPFPEWTESTWVDLPLWLRMLSK